MTDSPAADNYVPPGDSSVDAGPNARITVLHASPDFPPFRICFALRFGTLDIVASLPPGPDQQVPGLPFTGVFPGTGGVFPDVKDLSTDTVVVYAIRADKVKDNARDAGAQLKCSDYIGIDAGTTLTKNVDYFELAPLPPGTFPKNSSVIIGLTGCLPKAIDPAASVEKCGANYVDATGNLGLTPVATIIAASASVRLGST